MRTVKATRKPYRPIAREPPYRSNKKHRGSRLSYGVQAAIFLKKKVPTTRQRALWRTLDAGPKHEPALEEFPRQDPFFFKERG
jgi:hypothetical protein